METPFGHGSKILVVDDEPSILAALELILDESGFDVTTASNGKEARAAFAAGDRDAAADELLGMFEADREWNESAAKAKLLQIFEAVGLEDPWVVSTRRRLSRLLFG